jgi:hypothetical protein
MNAQPQPTVAEVSRAAPAGAPEPRGSAAPPLRCPPFRPALLRRQLALDIAAYLGVIAVVIPLTLVSLALDRHTGGPWSVAALIAMASLWVWVGRVNAGATVELAQVTAALDKDAPAAEAGIARALRRWPLHRALRLMFYHRLAVLRHRQERWAEAAAISQAVLRYRLGPAAGVRSHLLFLLVESRLNARDLAGAHAGLLELHGMTLGLGEVLQRTALQTRYEVAAGYDAQALDNLESKVHAAELMPALQSGGLHALLAEAAQRRGDAPLAAWLRSRAELLLTPQELVRAARLGRG